MAGPADYLRITGPLGGANFLTTADYNTAAKTRNLPVQQTLETVQGMQDIAGSALVNKQRQQAIAAEEKRVADEAAAKQTAAEAVSYATTLPSYSGAAAPAAAPAQAAPAPQSSVAPATTAQAYPAAPTAGAAPPMQQAATAAVDSGAPAPQGVAQEQPAPAPTALPPTAVPVPPAAKPVASRIQKLGEVITKLTADFDADKAKVMGDLQAGRVTPQVAQAVMQSRAQLRESEIERQTKLETSIAEITQKYASSDKTAADAKKAALEAAVAERDYTNGSYFAVLSMAQISPELGRAEAAKYGFNPADLFDKDGQPTKTLIAKAEASPEGKAVKAEEKKVAAEEKKANAIKWSVDKDTGLATGVDPKSGTVLIRDDQGNAITSAQYRAMDAAQRERIAKAGRAVSSGSGGGGGVRPTASGEISALKRDKQGNVTVDPTVVKQLAPAAKAYDAARQSLSALDALESSGVVDSASASGIGSAVSGAQKFVGLNTDRRVADERLQRFANSALGVIESPLMKGAPSEADARRALSVINDNTSSVETKKEALGALRGALQEAVAQHETAVSQYDASTRQRLKGLGISVGGEKTEARVSQGVTPEQFDAQWAKLPRGGTLVGPDGKTYVKK